MELKKSHFPIFILSGLLALLFSCEKDLKSLHAEEAKLYNGLLEKAEKQYAKQQYDSAFFYFNQSKNVAKEIPDADKVVYALIRMAALQQMQGDFSGSEASATESLDYLKNAKPVYAIAIYNSLGMASKDLSDDANAIRYYTYSLDLSKDPLEKAIVKNNIAVVYLENQKYKQAIGELKPLLTQNKVAEHAETHARILDNLGYAYFKTSNIHALPLLQQSLQIRTKIADDYGIIASYHHLAEYYSQTNLKQAKEYSLRAYRTASRINSTADRLETLGQLIKNAPANEIKPYSLIHIRLSDSLSVARQQAKNQFAKIRYDDAKKKVEIAILKIEKIQMANKLVIFIILFCCAVFVGIISYLFMKRKHKKEKIIEGYKAETKISKKVHDELANDIYNTITYTETQEFSNEAKENLLSRLDHVYARARDISRENSAIDTQENYRRQLRNMLEDYNSSNSRVLLRGIDMISWDAINDVKKIMTYRILQELMVNMKKHSGAAFVSVQFSVEGKNIQITYTDNGIGSNSDALFTKNGLQNVENRIKAISGTFIFDAEPGNGFRFTFIYPSEN